MDNKTTNDTVPSQSSLSTSTAEAQIIAYLGSIDSYHGYDFALVKDLSLVLAAELPIPKTMLSFTVQRRHTNRSTNLHGSCISAIFQISTLSALALVAKIGHWSNLGAGRSMRVTYLKPVEEGDSCWVKSEVVSVGKRMCKC